MHFFFSDVSSKRDMKITNFKNSQHSPQLRSKVHRNNPICAWLGVDQIMQIQEAQLCVFNCLQHLGTLSEQVVENGAT